MSYFKHQEPKSVDIKKDSNLDGQEMSLNLGENTFVFQDGLWKSIGKQNKNVPSETESDLKAQILKLVEENNFLKLKVDGLLISKGKQNKNVPSETESDLKAQNLKLEEENNFLKLKVEVLLNMLAEKESLINNIET